jgi:hypothetical protein
MLLFGKMLDPQPPSEVAVAPGVEAHPRRTRSSSRSRPHHTHSHGHEHATITTMTTIMTIITARR